MIWPVKFAWVLTAGFCLMFLTACDGEVLPENPLAVKVIKSSDEFNDIINSSGEKLLLFEFYADWCSPCKVLGPILEKIQEEKQGQVIICKINYDTHKPLARMFKIDRIPFVLFIKNKVIVYKLAGLHPEETYNTIIESYTKDSTVSPE